MRVLLSEISITDRSDSEVRDNLPSFIDWRDLKRESVSIRSQYGPNPYSDFLEKNGRRPCAKVASAMGSLMFVRLKSSDGSFQPKLTKADIARRNSNRKERREYSEINNKSYNIISALEVFSAEITEPERLKAQISLIAPHLDVRAQIAIAIEWLTRFAEETEESAQSRAD